MSPKEYLISQGVHPNKYVVIADVENVLRNVSLVALLEGYAKAKGCPVCEQFPMEPYVFEPESENFPLERYVCELTSTII